MSLAARPPLADDPPRVEARPPRSRRGTAVGVPLVVAVAVMLAAELLVRAIHTHLATPSAWPSPELQKKYDQIVDRAGGSTQVVLMGDSMMDAAGDPAALAAAGAGGSIYNASIAGETLPTIAEWTEKVVVPRLHPKVVVLGFSSNELNPASLAPATGIAAYHASRAVRAAEGDGSVVDRADAVLRQWSYLYRYRDDLRHPFGLPPSGAFNPAVNAAGEDLAFFNQTYLQGTPAHARVVVDGVIAALAGFRVGPQNVSILSGLLTWLRRRGIEVIFVVMPVTADLVGFHPGGAAEYQRAVAAFRSVAQSSGAEFSVPGIWPTSEFADPVHVNGAGTAAFSAFLAPLLRGGRAVGAGG
ncbi:MAG: hypothetical protein ACRDZ8_12385 [Acidimicrobiales bacterium]